MKIDGQEIPIEIIRHFGVELGTAKLDELAKLRDISEWAKDTSPGNLTQSITWLQAELGAPAQNERTFEKIWKFVKTKKVIESMCGLALFVFFLIAGNAFADTKISQLPTVNSNQSTDLAVTVSNPNSAPITNAITWGNVTVGKATALANTPSQCNAGYFPQGVDTGGNALNCTLSSGASYWTPNGSSIYNNNGGNVGIGTSTPLAPLDVYNVGTSNIAQFRDYSSALQVDQYTNLFFNGDNQEGLYYDNDVRHYTLTTQGALGTWITSGQGNNTTAPIVLFPGGGGNIGIGTLTVTYPTTVNWGIGIANGSKANVIASNGIVLNPSGSQNLFELTGSNNFGIATYLPQGGNVGIGTGNPQELLSVAASIQAGIGSQTNPSFIAGNDLTTGIYAPAEVSHAIGFTSNGVERMRIDQNGNLGINSMSPGSQMDVQSTLNGIRTYGQVSLLSGNVGIGSLTPRQTLDVTGTVRMTGLTLTGNGANNGYVMVGNNVGIGSWMPISSFNLQNNLSLVAGTYTNGDLCTYSSSGTLLNCNTPNSGSNYWGLGTGGNVGIGTVYSVGIGTTAGNFALSVMNGNVGIGTFNPTGLFMVNGGNVGLGTFFTPTNQLDVYNTFGFGKYAGVNNAPAGVMIIGGNIDIGTFASANALDVKGAVYIGSAAGQVPGPSNGLFVSGNVGIDTTTTANNLTVGGVNNAFIVSVDGETSITSDSSSGNTTVFEAQSSGISSGHIGEFLNTNSAATGPVLLVDASNSGSTSTMINIANSGTGYSIISNAGNVGVNSATPGSAMDIQGTASMTLRIFGGNVGISTTNSASLSTGCNGSGVTSCICKQFEGGICVNCSCT